MYRYTVRCEFTFKNDDVIEAWLAWLRDPHIADVMRGGATAAEIVSMAGELPTYEIRYQFANRRDFEHYQKEFAPQLRDEGLSLFPATQLGMVYSRSDGEVIYHQGLDR